MSVSVIVVAAGSGKRFGAKNRALKQFQPLRKRPLLYWSLRVFEKTPAVSEIVLVVPSGRLAAVEKMIRSWTFKKIRSVVAGGGERSESVANGYAAVSSRTDTVLVHDAARPLVSREIVDRVIAASRRTGAALAGWPVPDTLKSVRGGKRVWVTGTIPRSHLWLAQTPQGFRRDVAEKLFAPGRRPALTDDVQLAEKKGYPVEMVKGSPVNLKVTFQEDLWMCDSFLKNRRARPD